MEKRRAFLFPGQGAQTIGMGQDLYEQSSLFREILDRATEACPFDLKKIMWEGPEEKLNATNVCQPAILAVSYAILEVLREQNADFSADFCAGLSLGEYTALLAANAVDLEAALELVILRGEYMQEACERTPGGMASVLGLESTKVEEVVAEIAQEAVLAVANYNSPTQTVISGEKKALAMAEEALKKAGAKRVIPLRVAGAYHSPLMEYAAEKLQPRIEETPFREPEIPVISNVTAREERTVEEIRQNLSRQVTAPVRWCESMEYLIQQGMKEALEIGPGRVLRGLMRNIDRSVSVINVATAKDVEGIRE